jgi:hypothetical protein
VWSKWMGTISSRNLFNVLVKPLINPLMIQEPGQ